MSDKAKLPALPRVNPADPALARWVAAVTERLEVREGARGDDMERVLTVRDLDGLTVGRAGQGPATRSQAQPGDLVIDVGAGRTASVSAAEFAAAIQQSSAYKSLLRRIDDPDRFDALAQEVRAVLSRSVLDEAISMGADISHVQTLVQDQARSLAMVVDTLTAAIDTAQAGVREVRAVSATADEARAEQITQLEARLSVDVASTDLLPTLPASPYATLAALVSDVPTGDPRKFYRVTNPAPDSNPATDDAELLYRWDGTAYVLAGVGNSAKIEERMSAVASRTEGLEAQYTLKLNAGGAVAGIGLAATSSAAGVGSSALILQADKIAFVGSSETVGTGPGEIDPVSPDPTRVPFGVDTATGTVYINGSLRVGGATGPSLDEISASAGIYVSYTSQFFKYNAAGVVVNPTVTLTANVTGTLTGTLEWEALSGYSGTMPADVTVTTPGAVGTASIAVADLTGDTAAFSITLTDGSTVYTDYVTLSKLRDGSDAYVASLTSDSVGVPCSSAGSPVVGAFATATGTMEVYRGSTKLTSGVTYSVSSNPQGLTASINSSTGSYSVTAKGSWTDATPTATLTLRAVVSGGPTLTKDFVLTKNLQGVSGFYSDYVFIRAASAPTAPTTASDPTAQGWSDTPPAGSNPLYMSTALRDVLTDVVSGTWATPARLEGATGATGAAGPYTEAQYAKNSSSVTAPVSGYASTPPTLGTGEYLWMQTRTVTPPGAAPAWGAAVRISGEKGEPGANGQNIANVLAYRRSATALTNTARPGSLADGSGGNSSYNFTTSVLTLPAGTNWSTTPPAGTDPLYVTAATAASATSSDTIPTSEWSTPAVLVSNGADGLNVAPVYMYMRTTSASAPSITNPGADATYTFSAKALTGTLPSSSGGTWSSSVPASGGQYLWVSIATAASATNTDTIGFGEWSTARLLSYNGADGASAVVIDLSNDSHPVPCSLDGSSPNFTGATTTASVYIGPSDDSANWTWTTAVSGVTISGANTRTVTITGLSADAGYVDFTASKAGFANQTARFSVVRAKGGGYSIVPSVDKVAKSTAGVFSPASITFSAQQMAVDGSTSAYTTGRYNISTSTDGATWTSRYTSGSNQASASLTIPAGTTHIRGILYLAGGTSVVLDQETVAVVLDGANGINGVDGTNGTNAKTAILSADSLVFKANAANVVQTPDFIKLEVLKQNTAANVSWSTSPAASLYTTSSGSTLVTTQAVAYLKKADFGANAKVTVTTVCDGITDAVTLVRTVDGVDAPVVAVSNPSHALPSDSVGTVSSYTGSGTTLQVFVSGAACTITGVTRTATGITAGAVSGTGSTTATIAAHSAATADTARVEYAITYTKPDGTAGTAYAAQAIYKQKAGATGGAGSTGVRGNIVTKISGAWSATTAAAQIASIASAAGAVPTTPIKGDIVSYTGGAKECSVAGNPGTWVDVAAYIDGSLVVTGTISAAQLSADAINGKTISVDTTGHIRGGQTDYNTGKGFFLGYSGGDNKFSIGKPAQTASATASTDKITLAGHGLGVGDFVVFDSNGGATGLAAGTAYSVSGAVGSDFYVGTYTTNFFSGEFGGITATNITANGSPIVSPTNLLWDGNSILLNGELRIAKGVLTTAGVSQSRWTLDKGELRGITSGNKQLLSLTAGPDSGSIRLRSDSIGGIPLQVMRSVGGIVPVVWFKANQPGVEVLSVINDGGTAATLTGNSATEATLEATNSNASGVAVEANGRVEASKTLRVTGSQPPSSGVGLELAYSGGIGYVTSYNRNPTTPLGPPAPRPLHMISSETVLGGTTAVPATATSAGTPGQIAWDASFAYFCTAPNTWRRVALAGW